MKKILSILLCIVFICGTFPIVLAASSVPMPSEVPALPPQQPNMAVKPKPSIRVDKEKIRKSAGFTLFSDNSDTGEEKSNAELDALVHKMEALFGIDSRYFDFFSDSMELGTGDVYYMRWDRKTTNNDSGLGYIEIFSDIDGHIFMVADYRTKHIYGHQLFKPLLALNVRDAISISDAFIKKVLGDKATEIVPNFVYSYIDMIYQEYVAVYSVEKNGVPVKDAELIVWVDMQDAKVCDYSYMVNTKATYGNAADALSSQSAQESFEKEFPVLLAYTTDYDKDNYARLVYTLPDAPNAGINALTGKRMPFYSDITANDESDESIEELLAEYYYYYYTTLNDTLHNPLEEGATLSEVLLDELDNAADLFTEDGIMAKLKGYGVPGFAEENMKRKIVLLKNESRSSKDVSYLYYITYTPLKRAKGGYLYATLDAKTGELLSYSHYPRDYEYENKLPDNAAVMKAEAFLQKVSPNQFAKCKRFGDGSIIDYFYGMEYFINRSELFYARYENDLPFLNNGLYVNYDTETGCIIDYYRDWSDAIEFTDVSDIATPAKAFDRLISDFPLTQRYVFNAHSNWLEQPSLQANLFYLLEDYYGQAIDAASGEPMYELSESPEMFELPRNTYDDVDQAYYKTAAEQLLNVGVMIDNSGLLKPKDIIRQKDFLALLLRSLTDFEYEYAYYTTHDSKDELVQDILYQLATEFGFIMQHEIAPEREMTRQEAVVYLVRAMGLDKVADKSDMFNIPFKDRDSIDPVLSGYVAIAKAYGIINGDTNNQFNPNQKLKRCDAIMMINNLMKNSIS